MATIIDFQTRRGIDPDALIDPLAEWQMQHCCERHRCNCDEQMELFEDQFGTGAEFTPDLIDLQYVS